MLNEPMLMAVLEAHPDGVALVEVIDDTNNKIVFHNPLLSVLFEWNDEELTGCNLFECFSKNITDDKLIPLKIALQGEMHRRLRLQNYRNDGSIYWLELNLSPHQVDDKRYMIVFLKDISQMVATEHKLVHYRQEIERVQEKLQQISPLDEATQLLNRKHFELRSINEMKRACREQRALSCMKLRIDYFDNYRYNYGNQQSNHLLKNIADILNQYFQRPTDIVGRFAREEFAVITADDKEVIYRTAQRLRLLIEQEQIPFTLSPLSPFVTVSVGAATIIPTHDVNFSFLIEATDTALQKAEQAGFNRAECYEF